MSLAEVNGRREHRDLDHGSSKRLEAAAANKMDAYGFKVKIGKFGQERSRIRKALGQTLAKYFEAARKP